MVRPIGFSVVILLLLLPVGCRQLHCQKGPKYGTQCYEDDQRVIDSSDDDRSEEGPSRRLPATAPR